MEDTIDIEQNIATELNRLDREISKDEQALKEKKEERDTLKKSWNTVQRFVASRRQRTPEARPSSVATDSDASVLDATAQRVVNAMKDIGRFAVSRDVARKAGMHPKKLSRLTPRLRNRGVIIAHPWADSNSKFHYPLGLPTFLDVAGDVLPKHEYEEVSKLPKR